VSLTLKHKDTCNRAVSKEVSSVIMYSLQKAKAHGSGRVHPSICLHITERMLFKSRTGRLH